MTSDDASWASLLPPPDSRWHPTMPVSICVPARDPGPHFTAAMRWLGRQTYPHDLLELVVADDSSTSPIDVADLDVPFPARVVRQDVEGFAAGRARHLAAEAADGDIVVFLDADLFASPVTVESYVRWIARDRLAVPFGFCRFVDPAVLDDETAPETAIARLLADDPSLAGSVDSQEWREGTLSRADQLRCEVADGFRVVVGASLAVGAEQYRAIGGFADVGVRGIEDIEFGYRLQNNGAYLIPERQAQHIHIGARTMSSRRRVVELKRARAPYAARLLPVGGFRGDPPPDVDSGPAARLPIVPRLIVHVDPTGVSDTDARSAAERIRSIGGSDVDVRIGSTLSADFEAAFAQVVVRPDVVWSDDTAARAIESFERRGVGTLLVVWPDRDDLVEIVTTRCLRRAGEDAADPAVRRRIFGIAVVQAATLGLVHETPVERRQRQIKNRIRRWVGVTRRGVARARRMIRSKQENT